MIKELWCAVLRVVGWLVGWLGGGGVVFLVLASPCSPNSKFLVAGLMREATGIPQCYGQVLDPGQTAEIGRGTGQKGIMNKTQAR